jgi:hypothetical protein
VDWLVEDLPKSWLLSTSRHGAEVQMMMIMMIIIVTAVRTSNLTAFVLCAIAQLERLPPLHAARRVLTPSEEIFVNKHGCYSFGDSKISFIF